MSSGGKGGSSSGSGKTEVRYAPYLEEAHNQALKKLKPMVEAALGKSPYGNYEKLPVKEAMFGEDYVLTDFPSMWDMYGKFMAGLDVEDLWSQMYTRVTRGPEIADAVSAQSAMLQDEIDTRVNPQWLAGMRDINAVHSSAFITGKAIIQDSKIKAVSKFAGDIRIESFKVSASMWHKHLDWNAAVIEAYREMFRFYFVAHMDEREDHMRWDAKHLMWDLNTMEHVRGMLGALGGGHPIKDENVPSPMQRSLGAAISGAAAGASIGGPMGAFIGGGLGLISSFI